MPVNLRKTKVIRYFKAKEDSTGAPIPGTEDEDVWIDVEMLTGYTVESGAGPTFRRTHWVLDEASTLRKITWLKVYRDRDNDPDTWVSIPIPNQGVFETGEGPTYRRHLLKFDNSPDNRRRKTIVYKVFHAEFGTGPGGVDVDKDQVIEVEVISEYVKESGAGPTFKREIWLPAYHVVPLTEDLPENQYWVHEKPGQSGPRNVWPSSRERKQG